MLKRILATIAMFTDMLATAVLFIAIWNIHCNCDIKVPGCNRNKWSVTISWRYGQLLDFNFRVTDTHGLCVILDLIHAQIWGGGYSQRKIQVFISYYIKLPKIVPPFPSKRIFSLWGNFLYLCMWCCTYMYMFIDHHSFSQIEEQKKYLSKNVCHIGLGTPNRICSLLKSGRDSSVNRDS